MNLGVHQTHVDARPVSIHVDQRRQIRRALAGDDLANDECVGSGIDAFDQLAIQRQPVVACETRFSGQRWTAVAVRPARLGVDPVVMMVTAAGYSRII
jgi:hypothetical protein